MEVYQSLPEGTRCELINEVIYMSPSPLPNHQVVLNEINFQLMQFFKSNQRGMVLVAPFDVYLDDIGNVVQPDISIVLKENRNQVVLNKPYHGVPDLVVEVLSPSNKDFDLINKKELYEKFRVKEYWIVDPSTKLSMVYELKGKRLIKKNESIGEIYSELLNLSLVF
jgi:Uma2 family endonuclease